MCGKLFLAVLTLRMHESTESFIFFFFSWSVNVALVLAESFGNSLRRRENCLCTDRWALPVNCLKSLVQGWGGEGGVGQGGGEGEERVGGRHPAAARGGKGADAGGGGVRCVQVRMTRSQNILADEYFPYALHVFRELECPVCLTEMLPPIRVWQVDTFSIQNTDQWEDATNPQELNHSLSFSKVHVFAVFQWTRVVPEMQTKSKHQ